MSGNVLLNKLEERGALSLEGGDENESRDQGTGFHVAHSFPLDYAVTVII